MLNLWERQEGETDKAWAAFVLYRDSGVDAPLTKTRQALGKETGYDQVLEQWSSKYDWPKRRAAYYSYLDSVRTEAVGDGIREDRKTYRDTVKREAAALARDAVVLQNRAMKMSDETGASLVLSRAAVVWEKARSIEGIALGLIEGGK